MKKRLSVLLLRFAESVFLWAHGWRRVQRISNRHLPDYYQPPADHPGHDRSPHRFGHAVNSLKFWSYKSWPEKLNQIQDRWRRRGYSQIQD